MFLVIGPWQILLILIILIIPVGIFLIGYFVGKGVGFKKAREEFDKDNF